MTKCDFCPRPATSREQMGDRRIEYCDEKGCRASATAWRLEQLRAAASRLPLHKTTPDSPVSEATE
jgi:hypothetical protein